MVYPNACPNRTYPADLPHTFHNVVGGSTWNSRIILAGIKDPSHSLVSCMTLNHINSLKFSVPNCKMEINTFVTDLL